MTLPLFPADRSPAASGEVRGRTEVPSEVVREILRAVGEVRFGSVEVVIHEARIVAIERREKIRFDGCPRG